MFGMKLKGIITYAQAKARSMVIGERKVEGFGMQLLTSVAIGLVTVGIVLAVGALVLAGFTAQTTAGSAAYNATVAANTGINSMAGFLPTIGIAAGGVAVLGLVLLVLSQFGGTGGSR